MRERAALAMERALLWLAVRILLVVDWLARWRRKAR